jgi:hypothetical protein
LASAPSSSIVFRQVEPVVDDRDRHRGGVVAVGQLGIGAARDEGAHRGFVPFARREHERGEAAGGKSEFLRSVMRADVRLRFGSAPAASSAFTTSAWPSAAAHISAVCF